MRLARALPLAVLLATCGGDDADTVVFPECPTPGQFVLEGELDGRDVSVTQDYAGFVFVNALSGPGVLEFTVGSTDQCDEDVDCPDGDTCVGGACLTDPQVCETATDCGEGQPCIDKHCQKLPRVAVTFDKLVANGDRTPARGTVELEDVVAGNCESDGPSGVFMIDADGGTYSFVLRGLKAAPFCGGAAITGEIRGCVQSESF